MAAAHFIQRDLVDLASFPSNEDGPGLLILTGPAGSGKSQIAAELARAAVKANYRTVAWIATPTDQDWSSAIRGVGAESGFEVRNVWSNNKLGDPEHERDQVDPGRLFINSLAVVDSRALVIFDGVLEFERVREWLPTTGDCKIVITTNSSQFGSHGVKTEIGNFTPVEAEMLLLARTGLSDRIGAQTIARKLGYLPVAVAQAGSVVATSINERDFTAYDRLLTTAGVSAALPVDNNDPYKIATTAAIRLAIDQATSENMERTFALNLCAISHPVSIPISFVEEIVASAGNITKPEASKHIQTLRDRSLITESERAQEIGVHQLTADVCVKDLTIQDEEALYAFIAPAVAELINNSSDSSSFSGLEDDRWRRSLGLVFWRKLRGIDFSKGTMRLDDMWDHIAGNCLVDMARSGDLKGAAAIGEGLTVDGHYPMAIASAMAQIYSATDQPERAHQALSDSIEAFPGASPELKAEAARAQARLHAHAGDFDSARRILEDLLSSKDLDLEWKKSISVSLAWVEKESGNAGAALDSLRHVQLHEPNFDSTSIDAFEIRDLLSEILEDLGDWSGAAHIARQSLELARQLVGNRSEYVLSRQTRFANMLRRTGNYGEALSESLAVTYAKEKALSADHPSTLLSRLNTGRIFLDLGLAGPAGACARIVMAGVKRNSPYDRVQAGLAKEVLAESWYCLRHPLAAARLMLEAEKELASVYPDTHPKLISFRMDMFQMLIVSGQLVDAERVRQLILEPGRAVLGEGTLRDRLDYLEPVTDSMLSRRFHRFVLRVHYVFKPKEILQKARIIGFNW